jgi:alpha-mannosidase
MRRHHTFIKLTFFLCTLLLSTLTFGQPPKPPATTPDITHEPVLYVVPYAHLDTQWNWDFVRTIGEYLPKTTKTNFDFFEKYPHYIFNFTGANRYRLIKEYYPEDFAKIKKYVAEGRWVNAGSSMEEGDVNSPSAEAIFRQILYGNDWFQREFPPPASAVRSSRSTGGGETTIVDMRGLPRVTSQEYMLPDCFGFPASLPSILAHAGIKGFSTQKLSASWQPAARVGGPGSPEQTPDGIPFNVGRWIGPDGKSVIAALNPESYTSRVTYDFSKTPAPPPNAAGRGGQAPTDWVQRIDIDGKLTGLYADYHYIGTGDTGGAVDEDSVKLLEAIVTKGMGVIPPPRTGRGGRGGAAPAEPPPAPGPPTQMGDGPVHVRIARADQMFLDMLKTGRTDKLPTYQGDLELINHSAGSLTSQTYIKRWNRQNEVLADAAERASVAAYWLGARPYPINRLTDAWTLVMGGHFHDTMAGTGIPKAYEYAQNDEVIALNQFAGIVTSAAEGVSLAMNTEGKGVNIVVFNSLQVDREDVVEANIKFGPETPRAVRVVGPDGAATPSQMQGGKVLFLAKAPANGFAVYDVQPSDTQPASTLKVSESSLENARYRVQLNADGDVSSVFDKQLNKELLSAPIRLAFQYEKPQQWPAWNMDWADQQKPPRGYVSGKPQIRVVENGPARVAVEVSRETEGSKFVQTIRLATGDAGNRVEFSNAIDWKIGETALKAVFPLAAENPLATYNWDVGTVQRHNDEERQFEVASHQWVDLTDKSGAYGVTILTDCKNGSDKPDDHTLRLTLVYSPGVRTSYTYQSSNDWGHHQFVFGLAGHAGDWRQGQTDWQAYRLNQPLLAFQSPAHGGSLGKQFSLLKLSNNRVRVLAMKMEERRQRIVVRMVEMDGKKQDGVVLTAPDGISTADELDGQENRLGSLPLVNSRLTLSFTPYQVRTVSLVLNKPAKEFVVKTSAGARGLTPPSVPVMLPLDRAIGSPDGRASAPGFDSQGAAIAAETLPYEIYYEGVRFAVAPAATPSAVVPKGQEIALPKHTRRIYILAAAEGEQQATFLLDGKPFDLKIDNWTGNIGLWDTRQWKPREIALPAFAGAAPGSEAARPRTRTEPFGEMTGIAPGYVRQTPVAWFASHHHNAKGENLIYEYAYLFAYTLSADGDVKKLTLPNNDKIRIVAITSSDEGAGVSAVSPLYDTLEK